MQFIQWTRFVFTSIRLNLRRLVLFGLSTGLVAFVAPEQNDLVELKEGLNLRSSAHFRDQDQNVIQTIPVQSRGVVKRVQKFNTGNYGVCVEFSNVKISRPGCSWVYFRQQNPSLELYKVSRNENQQQERIVIVMPEPQAVAIARRDLSAILVPGVLSSVPGVLPPLGSTTSPTSNGADAQATNVQTVRTIISVNNQAATINIPRESCPNGSCSASPVQPVESCETKNSYQKSLIEQILSQSADNAFFQSPQKEIITKTCIQRNMQNFSKSSSYYKTCGPGEQQGGRSVPRACIDENYLNLTSKAFNLVADCLGDYVVGYNSRTVPPTIPGVSSKAVENSQNVVRSAKQQAALSIFSFMAQESGMHINAQSGRGAGGPGQMTGDAIESVNNDLKKIRQHLDEKKDNPHCSSTLKNALARPLSTLGAACDRKRPENILQSMSYAFAYQAFIRRHLEQTVFEKRVFGKLISTDLPVMEKDRFMMEVTAWAHNTGPGGMSRPLAALLTRYTREGRSIRTAADIDLFLKELSPIVGEFNPSRRGETSQYYRNIQKQIENISPGGRNACLAP
jgi:hypothetical protein